ncbi:peptidase M18, aminopeptidase I, partial [Ramicandelaber brevisporus]
MPPSAVPDRAFVSAAARRFLSFVDASPSPFHAVASSRAILESAKFEELKERAQWGAGAIRPGGRYYLTRNASTIIAFAVGRKFQPGNGAVIVGAHTDSPCLKLKPVSNKSSVDFAQVGVQVYGGGIWPTWFDRDLSVAGRVIVEDADGTHVQKLVKVDEPIMRIPTLAIHLKREQGEKLEINKETQLQPLLGTVAELANAPMKADIANADAWAKDAHHPALLSLICQNAGVEPGQLRDFELCLYDTQKAAIGGLAGEFIHSARLDNLFSSFCAVEAIAATSSDSDLAYEENIRMVVLFDNEEIGSESAYGAASSLLATTLERVQGSLAALLRSPADVSPTLFAESMARSWLISADMAHSVHPNYADIHEAKHRPIVNGGVVIKTNANVRYATTA